MSDQKNIENAQSESDSKSVGHPLSDFLAQLEDYTPTVSILIFLTILLDEFKRSSF